MTALFATVAMAAIDVNISDDYAVEITNYGKKIELANKPFKKDEFIYLPLRELLEKIGAMDANESKIEWDNGKIIITITNDTIDVMSYIIEIGNAAMKLTPNTENNKDGYISAAVDMACVPILKNNTAYVPFAYIDYIVCQYGDRYKLVCDVWDKRNGNTIDGEPDYRDVQGLIFNAYNYNVENERYGDARDAICSFFRAFSAGDFDAMSSYCTENGRQFFGDGYCFGMTRAELTEVETVETDKFDFAALVGVNMTPHEGSVFLPDQTETAFYLILKKQNDGSYLIDEFATGL